MRNGKHAYRVLPHDRWMAAMEGHIQEAVSMDVVTFTSLVDASSLRLLRASQELRSGARPSYTALVIKAISLALRNNPRMNRLVLPWPFKYRHVQLEEVHAVVAVEKVAGDMDTVFAGLLRNSDGKTVGEITSELREMASVTEEEDPRLRLAMRLVRRLPAFVSRFLFGLPRRSPRLWVENRGGSFALTTVGKYGVDAISAKWPWPLTFTFGEVKERPMVVDGRVEARLSLYLTMAFKRQLTNGAPAARFFHEIVRRLERAEMKSEAAWAGAPAAMVEVPVAG